MQIAYRFLAGGLIVSLFALLGDVLRPKGFAGLFGAAPSVALATLPLTLLSDGKSFAAVEARSMVAAALAFFAYALACMWLLSKKRWRVTPTTLGMLSLWAVCAFGAGAWLLRSP
jgi:hypothetical protein